MTDDTTQPITTSSIEPTWFVADRRPRYDISWAITAPNGPSLERALAWAAYGALRVTDRYYIHELVKKKVGILFWRKTVSVWVPRYAVDASHNTRLSIERWGITNIPSIAEAAKQRHNLNGYVALDDGRLVTIRPLVRRRS